MATLTCAPFGPWRSRRKRAARIAWFAYMPVAMSAAEMPTRDGCSGVPVTLISPDSA